MFVAIQFQQGDHLSECTDPLTAERLERPFNPLADMCHCSLGQIGCSMKAMHNLAGLPSGHQN